MTSTEVPSGNPLHAAFYADEAVYTRAEVLENVHMAGSTFRVRIDCAEIAAAILPGQFLMIRIPQRDAPLLARPLALYDTVLNDEGAAVAVDIVYLVIGKMTNLLCECREGDQLEVWGPLGNGFSPEETKHLIMVAGGIGQTPFMALGREYLGGRTYGRPPRKVSEAERVTLCYGAQSVDLLAGVDEFRELGIDVRLATDDGTAGHHGFVTDVLESVLDESTTAADCRVVCCGPEPMMEAVCEICDARHIPCQVSLETPMACGIGICFSCVAKVKQADGSWDYRRTCVEGPVFDADQLVW